jgi:hypothetical protein
MVYLEVMFWLVGYILSLSGCPFLSRQSGPVGNGLLTRIERAAGGSFFPAKRAAGFSLLRALLKPEFAGRLLVLRYVDFPSIRSNGHVVIAFGHGGKRLKEQLIRF